MEAFEESERVYNPWLYRDRTGILKAVLLSVSQILFDPKRFFSSMADKHSISDALSFFILVFMMQVAIVAIVIAAAPAALGQSLAGLKVFSMPFVIFGVIAFFGMAAGLFLSSAFTHIFVLIFGGKGGYGGTLSVFTYGEISKLLALPLLAVFFLRKQALAANPIILLIGIAIYALVMGIWMSVIYITGMREIHKIGNARVIGIFLLPIVLLWLLQTKCAADLKKMGMVAVKCERLRSLAPAAQKESPGEKAPVTAEPAASGPIAWKTDLNEALAEAGRRDTFVMADFYADWCGWCKRLDTDTYSDRGVIELASYFVCVKINTDYHQDMAFRYGVRGYPTVLFLDSKGNERGRIGGYVGPEDFIRRMKAVLPSAAKPAASAPAEEEAPVSVQDKEKTRFRFGGIVYGRRGFKAVINDDILDVGDTVAGAKIAAVSAKEVRLVDEDGKEIILKQD